MLARMSQRLRQSQQTVLGSARGHDSLESAVALWCLLWQPWRVHCLNAVLEQPWPAALVHCLNAVLEFRPEPETANISPCRMA
jgi:hypothetical protein